MESCYDKHGEWFCEKCRPNSQRKERADTMEFSYDYPKSSFEAGQEDGKRLMKAAILDLLKDIAQIYRRGANEGDPSALSIRAELASLVRNIDAL